MADKMANEALLQRVLQNKFPSYSRFEPTENGLICGTLTTWNTIWWGNLDLIEFICDSTLSSNEMPFLINYIYDQVRRHVIIESPTRKTINQIENSKRTKAITTIVSGLLRACNKSSGYREKQIKISTILMNFLVAHKDWVRGQKKFAEVTRQKMIELTTEKEFNLGQQYREIYGESMPKHQYSLRKTTNNSYLSGTSGLPFK